MRVARIADGMRVCGHCRALIERCGIVGVRGQLLGGQCDIRVTTDVTARVHAPCPHHKAVAQVRRAVCAVTHRPSKGQCQGRALTRPDGNGAVLNAWGGDVVRHVKDDGGRQVVDDVIGDVVGDVVRVVYNRDVSTIAIEGLVHDAAARVEGGRGTGKDEPKMSHFTSASSAHTVSA